MLIVNLGFSGLAAVAALIASAFTGNGSGVSNLALAAGTALWFTLGASTWSASGRSPAQTPGMRFLGIRLDVEGRGLRLGRSVKRLIGMTLAAIPFGLGFLGILFDERRRAWDDRLSRVDVVYEGNERTRGALVAARCREPRVAPAPQRRRPRIPGAFGRSDVVGSSPS